ncbi:hypothetical protein HDU98_011027 [Podochytrium sp. JEL0797]|nr:hypothetical protein HDU98_011027 [Podochytrium sp. JEL0797]
MVTSTASTITSAPSNHLPPLTLGCVPEHFSIPFYHAHPHHGPFRIISCPGGTGQMLKRLGTGEIDLCVGLTEGLVAALANEGDNAGFRIVGGLTKSSLTWSVVVHPEAVREGGAFEGVKEEENAAHLVRGKRIGISRFGSGSHLIPFVIPTPPSTPTPTTTTAPFEFIQQNDISGLRAGIATGTTDAFLWERFTTKKYVDSGELSVLGSVTPEWPSFLFAVRDAVVETQEGRDRVRDFLDAVSTAIRDKVYSPEGGVADGIVQEIVDRFGYSCGDVESWFGTVEFEGECGKVDLEAVKRCLGALKSAGVVGEEKDVAEERLRL